MKQLVIGLLLLFVANTIIAQTQETKTPSIVYRGKITFERKYNIQAAMKKMMEGDGNNAWMETALKSAPKSKIDIFEMLFNETNSIYKPAKDGISETKMMMMNIPAEQNIVYSNFENKQKISEKKLFEKTYLVSDSFKNCKWKITEEFRKIAGYNCRRAETIIMDSCYVIAFYSDAFIAEGGPEGFAGLPGMILGVVMPRLNVSYFATKVETYLPEDVAITAPKKGTKTTNAELEKSVRKDLTQWGKWVNSILWFALL